MAGERSLPTPYAKESDRQVRQEQALSLRVKARDAGRRFWVRIATSRPQPVAYPVITLCSVNNRSASYSMGICLISISNCASCGT